MSEAKDPSEAGRKGAKPYTPPVLTEYGSVSKLTMAKGGSFLETPTATMSTSCL